jgi:AraC family transcriptional regulator
MNELRLGNFYGQIQKRFRCDGFLLSELRHNCARKLPEHAHEGAYFSLLLAGSYREDAHGCELEYSRFSTGFHPAGMAHRDEIGNTGGWFFTVELEGSVVSEQLPREPVMLEGPPLALRLFGDYRAGVLSPIVVESTVYDLIGEASRMGEQREPGIPRWLRLTIDTMRDDPSFPHTVKSLAADVNVHPVHLARVFRRRFGYPLSDFLHSLRLQIVMQQMANRDRSLADIACDAGFADQSHLTRIFKYWVGTPPATFRREWFQSS